MKSLNKITLKPEELACVKPPTQSEEDRRSRGRIDTIRRGKKTYNPLRVDLRK
jgi:hypothetical protein